jgi:hypothetical protein
MSSSETPEICQLLHYARLHGLASKTESSLGPTVGDNYRENYATFLNALNVQRLDISIAAKDLLASVLKEEMVDTRVEWENILPPAPVIGGQSDIVLFVTEKEEGEHTANKVCFLTRDSSFVYLPRQVLATNSFQQKVSRT